MYVNGMHVYAKYDQFMHNHCYYTHTCTVYESIVDTLNMALLIIIYMYVQLTANLFSHFLSYTFSFDSASL